ncbi:hypothetical protein B0A48_02683 [Cryoendolithus antarcticus]|uniref:Uncharacterized protein n=1 Tax=Cryoendolithus antarcticus TaxID=1507870 RepID=A0A1V8TL52_9PEZI|nr:hypothetical protein B0A48_02683 [Cryoendolithus antarcticus]
MAPSNHSSAASRVFRITELAEAILLRVPNMRELFFMQRINKSVRDTIRGSIGLQRRMQLAQDLTVHRAGSRNRFPRNPLLFGKISSATPERPAPFSIFRFYRAKTEVSKRNKITTLVVDLIPEFAGDNTVDHGEIVRRYVDGPVASVRGSWAATRVAPSNMPVIVKAGHHCRKEHPFLVTIKSMTGSTTLGEVADKLVRLIKYRDNCYESGAYSCKARFEYQLLV